MGGMPLFSGCDEKLERGAFWMMQWRKWAAIKASRYLIERATGGNYFNNSLSDEEQ
jgi:hypothetical protein